MHVKWCLISVQTQPVGRYIVVLAIPRSELVTLKPDDSSPFPSSYCLAGADSKLNELDFQLTAFRFSRHRAAVAKLFGRFQ